MTKNEWAIIYGDRNIFTSTDGSWAEAPPWNVQIVVVPNKTVGRELLCQRDNFLMIDGNVLNVNGDGFIDHMLNVLKFATLNYFGWPTVYTLMESGLEVDRDGLLLASVQAGITKVGRYLPTEEFRPLLKDAVAVKGLPKKSAWLRHEERLRR